MRALLINGVCAALLLGGCASKTAQSLVVISVDSDQPLSDVATLHATATIGATTRDFDVHPTGGGTLTIPPAQTFGLDVPRNLTGTVSLHVEARDSSGAPIASGDGSGTIRVGARADLTIHLAASATSSDDMSGPIPVNDMTGLVADMALPTGDMVVIPPAMLTIDKTMQSFGDIVIGKTSTTASFLIVNGGGMDSSVSTLTTGGADVAEFSIDTDCGPALPPGGRCHVNASITPTSAGPKTATFTLAASAGGSVGGTLTANALTAGAVKIQQPSGDCGSSLVGTQSATSASFTVKNTGDSPTTALTVGTSDAQFTASGCNGMTLAAGATCTVTVKFTPSASGTQNASLSVSATTGGTDTASLVGVGLKPASLSIAPPSYTFNAAVKGSAGDTATFTVSNAGDVASATMSTATISGSNASSFVITADNCKGAPVGPAPATCTILVQFKPQAAGSNSATLNVSAGSTSVGTPMLSGTGLNPAALKIAPTTMTSFTKGQTVTFTITNSGDVASSALAAASVGGSNAASFTVAADHCSGTTVGPSPASCTIDVKFQPTTTGTQSATLSTSATTGGSVGATLGGPGLNPASLKISPSTMTSFTKGQTVTFTITNSGEATSSALAAASIGGTNAASFTIAADHCSGTTVGPSPASCTIDVKFQPTTTGTQSATLSTSATTGGSVSATLGGPGLNPASLHLSPDHYTFVTTSRGGTGDTGTFTISNSGDVAAAALSSASLSGNNVSSFKLTDNCSGVPVGPMSNCTITVQFKPQVSGSNTATLSIPGSGLPTAALSGTATPIWVAETPPAGTPRLTSVTAIDKQNVYAVGDAGTILFRKSDGSWSSQSITSSPPDLTAVSMASATNIFAAGPDIYQSTGNGTWTTSSLEPFTGVWALSSADVWATWDTGSTDPNNGNAVYHYTPATGWKLARDVNNAALHGSTHVWGTSSSDLFVFGGYNQFVISSSSFQTTGSIYHLDGTNRYATQYNQHVTIAPQDSSLAVRSLWGSGSPASNLYAVTTTFGSGGDNLAQVVLHSTGDGAWDAMPAPAPTAECDAVWGYDASHVYFGCTDGVHLYDGSAWSTSLSSSSQLLGISGSNVTAPDVYAVGVATDGTTGVIEHYY